MKHKSKYSPFVLRPLTPQGRIEIATLGITDNHAQLSGMNIHDTDPTVSAQWVFDAAMRRQLSELSHYLVKG